MSERTILLVDDEENILSALARLLRRDGYKIHRAVGGKAGLEKLDEIGEVGVIISDQRMPEMTGTEFLGQVKERFPDTVRIVLSGYTDLNSVTDAINQGSVYKFLTKPWDDELLRKNVVEAFEHYELKQDNQRLAEELAEANNKLNEANAGLKFEVVEMVGKAQSNLKVMQMGQEILDCLPIGVVGVDDFGMVVLINSMAQQLLSEHGPVVIGGMAEDILPEGLNGVLTQEQDQVDCIVQLDAVSIQILRRRLGQVAEAQGTVLVMVPESNK